MLGPAVPRSAVSPEGATPANGPVPAGGAVLAGGATAGGGAAAGGGATSAAEAALEDGAAHAKRAAVLASMAPAQEMPHPHLLWVQEHLHHLSQSAQTVSGPALRVAEARRRPWWR
jgi:hypothetical protein